jgi:hypothetical protein
MKTFRRFNADMKRVVVRTGFEPVCHLWFSLLFTVATVPQAFCHSYMMSAYVYHIILTLRVNVRVYLISPPDYIVLPFGFVV